MHAAIALLVIGAVGIGAFHTTPQGDALAGRGTDWRRHYTLTLVDVTDQRIENREELRARLAVARGETGSGSSRPARTATSPPGESPRTRLRSAPTGCGREDLFVIGDQFNADGSVVLKVFVNPLVNLIWLAGIVFLLGSVVTMWPDAREQARLARRLAYPPAVREA